MVVPVHSALVVVNYASSELLARNLSKIAYPGLDVLVVDSQSSVAERERVLKLCETHGWLALPLDDNPGFGGAVNAGAAAAAENGAVILLTLNPDATIDNNSLGLLIDAAATDQQALVSPRIVTGSGTPWFDGADLYLDDGSTASWRKRSERNGRPRREWATGGCFAIDMRTWEKLGGFDEDYFMYWEDIDLSHRLLDSGGRLTLIEDALVVHDEGQTQAVTPGSRAKSTLYYRYNIRNRLIYAAKHLDAEGWRRWRRTAPSASYQILLRGGRRQLLGFAPWRAMLRGLRDGMVDGGRIRRARPAA